MGLGFKILIGIVVAISALTTWSFYKTTGKNGEDEKGKNERSNPPELDRYSDRSRADGQGPKAPKGLGQGGEKNGN